MGRFLRCLKTATAGNLEAFVMLSIPGSGKFLPNFVVTVFGLFHLMNCGADSCIMASKLQVVLL